jgi:hypothetical protein
MMSKPWAFHSFTAAVVSGAGIAGFISGCTPSNTSNIQQSAQVSSNSNPPTQTLQVKPTENSSRLNQDNDGFSNNDNRFSQQPFSRSLFEQVHQINRECGFYDVTSSCSTRTYAFKDASLITTRNGTESVKNTLTLHQAVSKQQALDYLKILNNGKEFDPNKAESQADKLIYRGCPYDAGMEEPAALCHAELSLTSDGKVAGIALTHTSP